MTVCPEDSNINSLERWGFVSRLFNFVNFTRREENLDEYLQIQLVPYFNELFNNVILKLENKCSVDLPKIYDFDSYDNFCRTTYENNLEYKAGKIAFYLAFLLILN